METVPPAIIVIFVILFAMLTFTGAMGNMQDTLRSSWEEMVAQQSGLAGTKLMAVGGQVIEAGTVVEYTLRNEGTTRLTDFRYWDVIVQYFDNASPAGYHVAWLPYARNGGLGNHWTVAGIYRDAAERAEEGFEPKILNPGEEIIVRASLTPAIGTHSTLQMVMVTPGGQSVSGQVTRNEPPTLVHNGPLQGASGQPAPITSALLLASDSDDVAADLIYTIVAPPQHGDLNLGRAFSQAAVDGGLLAYTNDSGPEHADRFEFTISDGMHTIGPYTFQIGISFGPELVTNAALTLAVGDTATLTTSLLRAIDDDSPPADLVYTVTAGPSQGTLNQTTFTQADIDGGLMTYTSTGDGPDNFTFVITDGQTTIGPFTFSIFTIPQE